MHAQLNGFHFFLNNNGKRSDGQAEWFADFYTCSYCGHHGRRLIQLVAKIKDDGEQRPCDNAEGAFYHEDIS